MSTDQKQNFDETVFHDRQLSREEVQDSYDSLPVVCKFPRNTGQLTEYLHALKYFLAFQLLCFTQSLFQLTTLGGPELIVLLPPLVSLSLLFLLLKVHSLGSCKVLAIGLLILITCQVLGDNRLLNGFQGIKEIESTAGGPLMLQSLLLLLASTTYTKTPMLIINVGWGLISLGILNLFFSYVPFQYTLSELLCLISLNVLTVTFTFQRTKQIQTFIQINLPNYNQPWLASSPHQMTVQTVMTKLEWLQTFSANMRASLLAISNFLLSAEIRESLCIVRKLASKVYEKSVAPMRYKVSDSPREDLQFMHEYCDIPLLRTNLIYRRSTMPTRLLRRLTGERNLPGFAQSLDFNIWSVCNNTSSCINSVALELYTRFGFKSALKVPSNSYGAYFSAVAANYSAIPFHTACHASEVTNTLFFLVKHLNGRDLEEVDALVLTIAGLTHNIGHPGVTNSFLIRTQDPMAIQYNDLSVLQNMQLALAFSLMKSDNCNFLARTEYQLEVRKQVIQIVLDSDMSKHFQLLSVFRGRVNTKKYCSLRKLDEKSLIFTMALKLADLSYCGKGLELHMKWAELRHQEFGLQGDREMRKSLTVSPYCSRDELEKHRFHIGLIKHIAIPLLEVWTAFSGQNLQEFAANIQKNFEHWENQPSAKSKVAWYSASDS